MIQSVRWKQLILTTFNQIPVRIHFSSMTRDSILLSLSLFYFFSISKGSGKSMMDLQTEIKSRRDRKRGKKELCLEKHMLYYFTHIFCMHKFEIQFIYTDGIFSNKIYFPFTCMQILENSNKHQ